MLNSIPFNHLFEGKSKLLTFAKWCHLYSMMNLLNVESTDVVRIKRRFEDVSRCEPSNVVD